MVRFTGKRNHIVANLPVIEQYTRVVVLTNIQVWIRGDYITLNRCEGATLINWKGKDIIQLAERSVYPVLLLSVF